MRVHTHIYRIRERNKPENVLLPLICTTTLLTVARLWLFAVAFAAKRLLLFNYSSMYTRVSSADNDANDEWKGRNRRCTAQAAAAAATVPRACEANLM